MGVKEQESKDFDDVEPIFFLAHPLYLEHLVFFERMYWKNSSKELRNI